MRGAYRHETAGGRRPGAAQCLTLAALLLFAPPAAHADFQEDYALGLRAIDEGRYDDARRYLEHALAEQSQPVDKVMLNGTVEQPYLPYHFLGIVAYKLGECDAAKEQWGNATNRRMIGRLNQIRQQEQRLGETCRAKTAATADKAAAPPEPTAAPEAPPAAAPAPAIEEKPPPARTPAPAERPAAKPPANDKAAAAEKPADAGATAERAPPPRLVRAVEAYLAGRYAEAARIEPESFATVRARFHAFVFRAAARYMLGQFGDKASLAGARSDAAAAFKLDAQAPLDAIVFSPSFRDFYAAAH
jgi:hypothetical protein